MADLISLASGYGSFLPPPAAVEAATQALQAVQLPVAHIAGLPALRQALAERYQGAAAISSDQVVVTPGAKSALYALLVMLLRPQDEVVLPTPNWFGFDKLLARTSATVRHVPLSGADNYALTPAALRAALTPRTRILLLSNPNNPTGRVYHRAELAALLEVTREFPDLYVLSDEIYNLISFGAEPVPSLLDFPDPAGRHVVVNGFSKSLALIGWGIGYLVAPAALAQACAEWQFATSVAVPVPAQQGALAATHDATSIAAELCHQLHLTRPLLLNYLGSLSRVPTLLPEATYYAFPDLRAYLDPALPARQASAALVERFKAGGVEVVDGGTCHAPGFVRISYAVPEPQLREALTRLSTVLAQHA